MLEKFINYIKGCCKENEEGKKKRKVVFIIGLMILFCKVFFKFFYKLNKFYYYSFGERFRRIKTFLLIVAFISISIWGVITFLNINQIN